MFKKNEYDSGVERQETKYKVRTKTYEYENGIFFKIKF